MSTRLLTMQSNAMSNSGALFRFLVVCLFFLLNFLSLVRLLFRAQAKLCVHSFSYGLVLIVVNIYLSTWVPYLFSSFYHATVWPLLEVSTHCAIQHLVTVQVSTLLLAILCLQKLFETFASKRAKLLTCIIFFTWIFPQTIYSIISEIISTNENNNLYFMDSGTEPNLPDQARSEVKIDSSLSQGVLFCIHRLDTSVISHMTWHYVVLVVPLTSLFIICTGAKRFAKSSLLADTLPNVNCHCSGDIVVTVCLCSNFIWLLFARPLLSLFALLRSDLDTLDTTDWKQPTSIESLPLDLGSHLILFLIAVLLPFSTRFGLFSSSFKRNGDIESNNTGKERSSSRTFYLPRL